MRVLALDTGSRAGAHAVVADERGTVLEARDVSGGQLDTLLPAALAALLSTPPDAVVVLTGPGSYTGVRAGMAAALGVATAIGVPLHGAGSLEAVAVAFAAEVTAVADAGRGGVYAARFVADGDARGPVVRTTVDELAGDGPFAGVAAIAGLDVCVVDPVVALAAAVPRALAAPPLPVAGLTATHAETPRATSR